MKKIIEFRKLLGVTESAELKDLKSIYRNLMKEWHPDKFQESAEKKLEAEEKSKVIIEAYHFLVSIAPETREQNKAEYLQTIATAILDFEYKSQTLQISFADGSKYEYFAVPKNTYMKLVNSESPARFARRHIYQEFLYRNAGKAAVSA